jgi:hypothetical protein
VAGLASKPPPTYWLVPASRAGQSNGQQILQRWLARSRWGIRDGQSLRAGDLLAFHVSGVGVVATAVVSRDVTDHLTPNDVPRGAIPDPTLWRVRLKDARLLQAVIRITPELRERLPIMRHKPPRARANWGWLVHTKRRLSLEDFTVLTEIA